MKFICLNVMLVIINIASSLWIVEPIPIEPLIVVLVQDLEKSYLQANFYLQPYLPIYSFSCLHTNMESALHCFSHTDGRAAMPLTWNSGGNSGLQWLAHWQTIALSHEPQPHTVVVSYNNLAKWLLSCLSFPLQIFHIVWSPAFRLQFS